MNGYHQDYTGYPPSGIQNNFKQSHPYNSYMDVPFSSPTRQQQMPMNGHVEYGQRMNSNPNQYIQNQQYQPIPQRQDTGSPGGFHPLGYGNRRSQQQPSQQQIYPPRQYSNNYHHQQSVSYAGVASQFIPSQQSIPVQSTPTQQTKVGNTNTEGNPLANLKMTLAEEKKQQEKSQEDYASRFLAAVQERVQNHVTSGINVPQQQQQYESYYEQSPDMYEFEASHQSTQQFQPSQDLLERIEQLQNKQIIFEVQIGLEQLCAEPSEYEAWSLAIRETLNKKEANKAEDYEVVSWMICEMAIYLPNCQANFARLSCYLMDYVQNFNEAFMPMLTYYHDARSELLIEQVEFLLLFTAEMYERKLTLTRQRTGQLAVMLIDQLRHILNRPLTDHVIKTIVDVLKLSGYHLEQDAYKDAVDDIMKDLNSRSSDGKRTEGLTDTGAGYITMLMIHRNEWGKQQNLTPKTETNPMDLTEEELGFLEQHNAINPAIIHNGSSSGEMDDEVLEDYEKFLRDHAEQTALASVEKIFEKLSVDEEDEDVIEENRKDDNKTPTPYKNIS